MQINVKQIAYNKSNRTQAIKYIVIHDTGNTSKGANAYAHFNYFNGGNRNSSADIFVDDTQVLQVNDYTKYYTWHCGDGKGKYGITNNNSIGIEMCINSDCDYDTAFNNTVNITKLLMEELNIPISNVVRHYDASRKNCPASMNNGSWDKWNNFKKQLTESGECMTQEERTKFNQLVNAVSELSLKIDSLTQTYNKVEEVPSYAKTTIVKLIKKGYLKGDSNGNLGIDNNMLRIFVINDRAGMYDTK